MIKKKHIIIFCLIFFLLQTNLCFSNSGQDTILLARWNINYANYLIDVGKYPEALEYYETAYEISTQPKIKLDALLSKAALFTSFLDAPKQALKVYENIIKEFPDAAEVALYKKGFLLFDLKLYKEAQKTLTKYLETYKKGRFLFQAELLLSEIKKIKVPPEVIPVKKIEEPVVRIRIFSKIKECIIEGRKICNKDAGCNNKFNIKIKQGALYVNSKKIKKRSLTFSSNNPIWLKQGKIKKHLRGNIVVNIKNNKLLVLNRVKIEEYLLSVVPSESMASWAMEALKAQAVASRTYAYYQIEHRKSRDYDMVDNEGDQAYKGIKREHPRTTKAVKATKGQLVFYNNKPILAMYSANSGGYTADAGAVFNMKKPYLKAKKDPESLKGKMANWTRTYTVKEIEAKFNRKGFKIKNLKNIEAAKKGPSGRIVKVKITFGKTSKIYRTRTSLLRALKLPEILLTITKKDNKYIFKGHGWGHGVGYSQWGSAYMAKKNNYQEILKFYYTNTDLVEFW